MSTQVRDLYNKHHEVSEDIKSLKDSIKILNEELDKAKSDNKSLQSEILLLVKQLASLEKIVNVLHLAQKLKDQKVIADKAAAGTPVGTTTAGGIYVPPGVSSPTNVAKGHGDANTPPSTPNTVPGQSMGVDTKGQPYWINDPVKGIVKNPDYIHSNTNDKKDDDDNSADKGVTADQPTPI